MVIQKRQRENLECGGLTPLFRLTLSHQSRRAAQTLGARLPERFSAEEMLSPFSAPLHSGRRQITPDLSFAPKKFCSNVLSYRAVSVTTRQTYPSPVSND